MSTSWTSRLSDVQSKRRLVSFTSLSIHNASATANQPVTDPRQLAHYCEAIDRLVAQGVAADQAAAVMRQCGGDIDAAELWIGSCFAVGLSCIPGGSGVDENTDTWMWEDPTGQLHLASSLEDIHSTMQQSAWSDGPGIAQLLNTIVIVNGLTDSMQQDMILQECARQRKLSSVGALTSEDILQRLSASSGIQSSRVIAIEEVVNPTLWSNYISCKNAMAVANEQWLFHGSGCENIARIVAEGFDIQLANISGSYGAGIYFASHSSTSHRYTSKAALKSNASWPTQHQCSSDLLRLAKEQKHSVLLLCTVLLGQEGSAVARATQAPPGSNSVGCSTVKVVYNSAQAYPRYIIAYR